MLNIIPLHGLLETEVLLISEFKDMYVLGLEVVILDTTLKSPTIKESVVII